MLGLAQIEAPHAADESGSHDEVEEPPQDVDRGRTTSLAPAERRRGSGRRVLRFRCRDGGARSQEKAPSEKVGDVVVPAAGWGSLFAQSGCSVGLLGRLVSSLRELEQLAKERERGGECVAPRRRIAPPASPRASDVAPPASACGQNLATRGRQGDEGDGASSASSRRATYPASSSVATSSAHRLAA